MPDCTQGVQLARSDALQRMREPCDGLRRLGAVRRSIFGSIARDQADPDSELDLLVEQGPRIFDRWMNLKLYREAAFGVRVDLVLVDRFKPALRGRLLAGSVHAG